MSDELDFDLDAAGLRADRVELEGGVEVLARKLEEALPAQTTVERRAKRLFSSEKVVQSIAVGLGETRYMMTVERHRLDCARAREVRGVVIKREPLDLDAWLGGLAEDLRDQARTSADARLALGRLLG